MGKYPSCRRSCKDTRTRNRYQLDQIYLCLYLGIYLLLLQNMVDDLMRDFSDRLLIVFFNHYAIAYNELEQKMLKDSRAVWSWKHMLNLGRST